MNQSKKITPLPLHFKKPGRSYSQIGRKGNVALYQVFSDYLIIPDFAQPYLCIGFELVVIKTDPNGVERYPGSWQFGKSAWSIPKSFSLFCRTRFRCCGSEFGQLIRPALKTVFNRSAITQGFPLAAALATN